MFNRFCALLFGASSLFLCSAGQSMEFRLMGSTLVMSGPVVSDDLARLRDRLATDKVKLIVLHESPGGDLWNGFQLGDRIRSEKLPTAVSGKCHSACGLIFLGGVTRSVSDGRPLDKTMVGLHGAHNRETKQPLSDQSFKISYFIRRMTDDKYPPELMDRTVYPKDPRDFVFFFHPRRFTPPGKPLGVMACQHQPDAKVKCAMVEAVDAISVGVFTDPDVLSLDPEVRQSLVGP
jgi:hypothetical protein